LKFRAK